MPILTTRHADDEAPEARLLLPVVRGLLELHKGQYEIEAGFFTKHLHLHLHVHNDAQTAISLPTAQNGVVVALAPPRKVLWRRFRRLRRTYLHARTGLSRRD